MIYKKKSITWCIDYYNDNTRNAAVRYIYCKRELIFFAKINRWLHVYEQLKRWNKSDYWSGSLFRHHDQSELQNTYQWEQEYVNCISCRVVRPSPTKISDVFAMRLNFNKRWSSSSGCHLILAIISRSTLTRDNRISKDPINGLIRFVCDLLKAHENTWNHVNKY